MDCAIIEDDGITVLDFKTDFATDETIDQIADRYRSQVQTYASAMERIYQKPVKATYLYFFSLDRIVEVL